MADESHKSDIISESHSKSGKTVLDNDPDMAKALRHVVVVGLKNFRKEERKPNQPDETAYLQLAKAVYREFKAECTNKKSAFFPHVDKFTNIAVVSGNMGFCGSIPCFRFKLALNTGSLASTWVNIFFQTPIQEHDPEDHEH